MPVTLRRSPHTCFNNPTADSSTLAFYKRYVRQRADGIRPACFNRISNQLLESHMFIGGGILGTILVIALIVYLFRRA